MDPSHNPGDTGKPQPTGADTASFRQGETEPLAPTLQSLAPQKSAEPDYNKPVAYDQTGAPLYAHPPTLAASLSAGQQALRGDNDAPSDDTPESIPKPDDDINVAPDKVKHEQSKLKYPELNLSAGEFVITALSKDVFGLLQIWGVAVLAMLAMVGFTAGFLYGDASGHTRQLVGSGLAIVGVLVFLFAYLAANNYRRNRLIVTNESIIEERQGSLLAQNQQTINLGNVQDVSYQKNGILASFFNFGTINLSTEADQTHYVFSHVGKAREKAALITNVVEAYNAYHGADD